jgi:putative DNA primase/helicase
MDGIFIWMINGLKRLRKRGYFERSESMKQEIEEYRAENNNVMTFVDEECCLDPNANISKQQLYNSYSDWCKGNGYRSFAKKKFGKELTKHFQGKITEERSGSERMWAGVEKVLVNI